MFENMSDRERVLAISVASLLPIFLVFFGFLWFMDRYEGNASTLDRLDTELQAEEDKTRQVMRASERQNYYRKISLPANTNRARIVYRSWLDDLITKKSGMTHFGVKYRNDIGGLIHDRDTIAKREIFSSRPQGTLPQLITFLHEFYSADHLHRINKLSIKPVPKPSRGGKLEPTDKLQIELEIETLSMSDAADSIETFPLFQRQLEGIDSYNGRILARNLFGPANNQPTLEKPRKLKFSAAKEDEDVSDKYVTVKVSAKDLDKGDRLSFELLDASQGAVSEAPAAKVVLGQQPRSASVRTISLKVPQQKAPTTIPVSMKVRDNGLPAKEDTIDFEVVFEAAKVVKKEKSEPKAEPLPVEHAEQTYVRGIVKGKDGRWLALIVEQLKSQSMKKLGVDDTIEIDGVTWKVVSIDRKAVTFEVDGEQLSFVNGSSLAEPLTL